MELESAKDLLRKIKGGRQEEPSDHSECKTPVEGGRWKKGWKGAP